MYYFTAICFSLTLFACADSSLSLCGPGLRCSCTGIGDNGSLVMDCTACHVVLADVCASLNASISHLKAGRNNFGRITKDELKGCENLVSLDLHYNQIGHLDTNVLDDMSQLVELDLHENNLDCYSHSFDQTSLPATLQVLNLGHNLPANDKTTTEHQHVQALRYPNLTRLQSLEVLSMDGFQADFGEEYDSLNIRNLSLSGATGRGLCNISVITGDMFRHLTTLEDLDLSVCDIRNIYATAFVPLPRLQRLNLAINQNLGFAPLSNISYGLQFTNISSMNYSRVYSGFGMGSRILLRDVCYFWNTSLVDLDISSNRIQLIDTNALILLPDSIRSFHVEDNKFTFGFYLFQTACPSKVKHFYGSHQNNFHSLFNAFADSTAEEDASQRSHTSDCPFMTPESLRSIAETKYCCSYIAEDKWTPELIYIAALPSTLETLLFSDSNMNYNVRVEIGIKPANNSLKTIDMSGNSISSLNYEISPLPKIESLNLANNLCSFIGPSVFDHFEHLQELDLHQNYLGVILADAARGKIFTHLKNLRSLNLASNRITKLLSGTFAPLVQLRDLDVSYNTIDEFAIDVSPLTNLLNLNLSNTVVGSLSPSVLQQLVDNGRRLHQPFYIDLRGNTIPFVCDNRPFLTWMEAHEQNMVGFPEYMFVDDNKHRMKPVAYKKMLLELGYECQSYTAVILICSMTITLFLAVTLGALIHRNRWNIKYLLYVTKIQYFGYGQALAVEADTQSIYKYGAFISYAEEDSAMVRDEVIPSIERENDTSLCIHQRDFLGGKPTAENILYSIKNSRKTVVLLSRRFLKRYWCIYEFNMARMESIYSRGTDNACLVIVMLEDVPVCDMPLEMAEWIRHNTYIEYTQDETGNRLFRGQLRAAIYTN